MALVFRAAGATHVGAFSEVNEDAYGCASGATAFAVAADGTGGASSGRIAADGVVEEVRAAFRGRAALVVEALARAWWRREHGEQATRTAASFDDAVERERDELRRRVRLLLARELRAETPGDVAVLTEADEALFALPARAFAAADARIHAAGARNARLRGMGATAVAAIFEGGAAGVAHCGDARVYRLRDGAFTQLTVDHTLAAEAASAKITLPPDLHLDADHVLLRALGTSPPAAVDELRVDVRARDLFLFATRGAFLGVSEADLAGALRAHASAPEAACAAVVEAALAAEHDGRRGAWENVTAVVVVADATGA